MSTPQWNGVRRKLVYRDIDFWQRDFGIAVTPAIDNIEKDNAYEITAELPGLDAKNIDLQQNPTASMARPTLTH